MEKKDNLYTTKIRELRKKLEENPLEQELWFELGNYYWEEGNYSQAKFAYLKALEVDEAFAELLGNLGAVLLELGEIEEAVEWLEMCLNMAPRDYKVYQINLANALFLKGEKKEAKKMLKEALRKSNDPEEQYLLRYNLGLMELDENPSKSVKHFTEATKLRKNPKAYYELACALARIDKISQSATALKKAIEQDPSFADIARKDPDLKKTIQRPSIMMLFKQHVKESRE